MLIALCILGAWLALAAGIGAYWRVAARGERGRTERRRAYRPPSSLAAGLVLWERQHTERERRQPSPQRRAPMRRLRRRAHGSRTHSAV
ncbi:MAG: hypothetical protein ACYCUM_02360 [Solirubrobacteraceae bacterium]